MKKLTQIEELFNEYQTLNEYEGSEIYNKAIYELALNSKQEKESLIKMFYEEKNADNKFFLVEILAKLKETCIVPYMLTIINTEDDLSERVWAAAKLVQVNYSEALKIIMDLMNKYLIDKQTLAWEIFQLDDLFAQNLLKTLEKIDVDIKKYVEELKT